MPSFSHEALLELFRRRPTLALELLRDALSIPVSSQGNLQVGDSAVNEVTPNQRSADLVLLVSASPGGPPRRALVIEVQLSIDPEKRTSWWQYLLGVHARHRCDAMLVVVTTSRRVAAWAARPIRLGHPGVSLRPIVLGPDAVPVIRDASQARRSPELAVLSAMVHGRGEAAEDVGRAALAVVRTLDDDKAALYTDMVLFSMRAAARAILEDLMANGTYRYQSDFAKRYVAQGVVQGRTEGLELGRTEGRAEGKALAVLAVLAARAVDVPDAVRAKVLACTDAPTLDAWITRAVTVKTASELVVA